MVVAPAELGVSGIHMYAVVADFVLKPSNYMHKPGSLQALQLEHHHLVTWRAFHPSKWSAHYYGQVRGTLRHQSQPVSIKQPAAAGRLAGLQQELQNRCASLLYIHASGHSCLKAMLCSRCSAAGDLIAGDTQQLDVRGRPASSSHALT